jgi:hypothetical protein
MRQAYRCCALYEWAGAHVDPFDLLSVACV